VPSSANQVPGKRYICWLKTLLSRFRAAGAVGGRHRLFELVVRRRLGRIFAGKRAARARPRPSRAIFNSGRQGRQVLHLEGLSAENDNGRDHQGPAVRTVGSAIRYSETV